ncbi:piezo-type mechanosensitive ion channel component 1 isoform X3 [Ornithorhynchus anatinus]|uniref:piezo-type mechanosensitive ion channel component 1 isoform X3 n=1 Tax=Ornithorhynchus anatinus TaxID=9258 RepID=UPI0010A94C5D|nr:piezo-type mechanosensitive ion channel component 1 isoform X3 [Ornithorhynchus anatinus]
MELQGLCGLFYWLLLPLSLLAACLFRFNALSLIYLLFLLLLPWFLGPTKHSVRGHTGRLLRALLTISILFLVAHLIFQICLHTVPRLDQLLGPSCSTWETLARHVGVTRLDLNDIPNTIRLVAPDLGILLVSSICLGVCNRLRQKTQRVPSLESPSQQELDNDEREAESNHRDHPPGAQEEAPNRASRLAARLRLTAHWMLKAAGKTLAIVLLALAGITLPSAFSSVYYLLFVGICTWWACHFPISHLGFNTLCVMVGCFAAGHLVCLYCYQTPYIQGIFPPAGIWARVFGLKDIITHTNCTSPNALVLNTSHDWPVYVSPGILLLLYYTVASLLKLRKLDTSVLAAGDREVELMEMGRGAEGRARALEETKHMLPGESPGATPTEAENCTVHVLQSQAPRQPVAGKKRARLQESSPLHALGHVIMNQSYVCALIAMMVWSITYHSWLTFILLLWACLIWIVRSRHHLAMLCSPFILLYGLALCSLQYVWAMDLEPELPTKVGFMSLHQLGLVRTRYPCLNLGAMLLYTLTFWLLLRQFVKEKLLKKKKIPAALVEVTVPEAEPTRARTLLKMLGELVTDFYAKYWIYVCAGMFIVVSFAGRLVVYKIVYMFLFLLCLTLFQVYYSLWRKLLKVFWWLVVAYTMLVLIAVYTFQFQDFPMYWRNLTGFTNEQLGDLGLEQFSVSELFSSILIPGFFLLACILQLHYFHRPFMRLTDLEHIPAPEPSPQRPTCRLDEGSGVALLREEEEEEEEECGGGNIGTSRDSDSGSEVLPSKWGLVMERLTVLGWRFSDTLTQVQVFVRRLLELHICKLVALYTVWVALKEVSVMNFLLVVLWAFALPYSRFRHMASCLSTVWTCIIIVCKMLYQLKIVDPHQYSTNCTEPSLNSTNLQKTEVNSSLLYRGPVDPANWFGIRKGYPNLGYIQNHLLILLLLVFEAIVYRRQEYYRKQYQLSPPPARAVFADGTRQRLDQGLLSCIKYFVNFFYYKFGLEICFLMTVNVIGQRMNFMVILHGCWLVAILTRRQRAAIAHLWPNYCLFLALFLLYQYLLCVGIPPALCMDYPWRWSQSIPMNSALIKWMYLPDFFSPPKSTNLISDFLLLLCASQQWQVFVAERSEEWQHTAGLNTDRLEPLRGEPNPVPNFINCRSYLDMLKVAVFRYLFWLVLVVVFITGAIRISVFGLGYLLACFYLLLFGTSLLQKRTKAQLVLWDCLILYNVTVVISKNMLSLLSCVFVQQMQSNFCWVIQLFSLVCTVKGYYDPKSVGKDQDCVLPVEEAGVIWDSICFFFLLLQRRIFLSYYFLHVAADLQATALQASRGFALYRASILKSISFHRQAEKKSLAQLKRQMERIRAKQEKYHQERSGSSCPENSAQEPERRDASQSRRRWWRPWLDHATVLHSGDYFLFESDSEEEEETQPEDHRPSRQSAFQLAYQAWVTNAQSVLRRRQQEEEQERSLEEAGRGTPGGQRTGDGACPDVEPSGSQEEEVSARSNVMQRILNILHFLWVLGQALVDGLTQWLHTFTRHHANISTVLRAERYVLTQELAKGSQVNQGVLDGLYRKEEEGEEERRLKGPPGGDFQTSVASSGCGAEELLSSAAEYTSSTSPLTTGYNTRTNSEEVIRAASTPEDRDSIRGSRELLAHPRSRTRTASELLLNRRFCFEELEESERFYRGQSRGMRLLRALYLFVAAHSDLVCYFIIILNNMVTASAVSLVLPVLVFLWAMLSIPRPSKRFWMTAIIFTEVMVIIKYLFQFGFFPWNGYTVLVRNKGKPYFPPRILGLEKTDSYVKYDLIQLMALFFHRSLLLCYGLWDHEEDPFAKEKERADGKERLEEEPSPGEPGAAPSDQDGVRALDPPTSQGTAVVRAGAGARGSERGEEEERRAEARVEEAGPRAVEREPEPSKNGRRLSLRFRKKKKSKEPVEPVGIEEEEEGEEEEEKKAEDEREKKPSRSQIRMKAAGLRVKSFCLAISRDSCRPVRRFFRDILHTPYRAATDVYALMFLADVVDFIIIIFGFWAFGKHSAAADITSSLSDDQVPEAFLVMLLIQFSTMVIDRALYLRKTVLGKLIFQVLLVIGIHLWMFFILPAVTERMFSQNAVAQLWYFVKCIYFALSAYQIRCGYPTRILGNFLTKKYNHLNLFLFQGFRLVPFLVELRAVMDWVWTDTTLSLSNWMCVEDIYANIFIIKCSRETEKKYPQPKGQKKKKIVKYGMGGLIILFLIAIIWFPLLFMSLVRSVVGVVNHPIDVTVTLKLGGYEPLFTMSAQQQSLVPFSPNDYETLTKDFEDDPLAMQFITLYGSEDIITAQIEGSSGALWRISPPSREQMKRELRNGSSSVTLRFTWDFQRDLAKGGTVEHTNEKHTMDLEPGSPECLQLADMLQGSRDQPVVIRRLFPKYIRAPNGPEANPVKQLQPQEEANYTSVELQLKRERVGSGADGFLEWWVMRRHDCSRQSNCHLLPMVIFSDKVSPPSLGFLAGYGIMGLYVSIVLVIGKFVRGFFSEISHSIMFEELPCVDRILKLCQDIFLVRETGELELEEELYAKLIFLYRSPETMIKWTREKEE